MSRNLAATLLLACGLACGLASARQPDGTLGTLVLPNSGRPAVAAPGDTVRVVAAAAHDLALARDDTAPAPLDAAWAPLPGGRFEAYCTLPALPPGRYALLAGGDRNAGAVFVRDPFPGAGTVAHVAAPALDATTAPRFASFLEALATPSGDGPEPPLAVLVTGPVTAAGAPADLGALASVLDHSPLPVVLCPGGADDPGDAFARYFGPTPAAVRIGPDALLLIDSSGLIPGSAPGQAGHLERLRRSVMAARWTFAAAARYAPATDTRLQLVLFVDNPVDALLISRFESGPDAEALEGGVGGLPWGRIPLVTAPPWDDGRYRPLAISPREFRPLEVATPPRATRTHAEGFTAEGDQPAAGTP